MKKIIVAATSIAAYFGSTQLAFAQLNVCGTGGASSFNPLCLSSDKIGSTLGSIVNLLFLVAGIIALIYLVIGGIKWITSEGDSKNVEGARNQIIAAAIGLALTFLSYLIINLLMKFFLGTDLNGIKLPTLQ